MISGMLCKLVREENRDKVPSPSPLTSHVPMIQNHMGFRSLSYYKACLVVQIALFDADVRRRGKSGPLSYEQEIWCER